MLDEVIAVRQSCGARWQSLGFIHGVMNTDNMLLSGETIDYGPCAFMDELQPGKVFSSIDHGGRYAYGNQPQIAHWNLSVLTQALLPFLDEDPEKSLVSGQAAIDAFPDLYQRAYIDNMLSKLGLTKQVADDVELTQDLLKLMHENQTDFTLTFRYLSDLDPQGVIRSGAGARYLSCHQLSIPGWSAWQQKTASRATGCQHTPAGHVCRQPGLHSAQPRGIEEAISAAGKASGILGHLTHRLRISQTLLQN